MVGSTLGHYEIVDRLGAGGMGEVYLARDTTLDREVALKVLPPALANDEARLRRLQREAKALATLDHPGIVTVFSVEQHEGVHFLTMARVAGKTLAELIPAEGFPVGRLLELGAALADALRAAHEHGIVHRDLKPSNVMVDADGRLRVLDFGLSRVVTTTSRDAAPPTETVDALTRQGAVLGTVPYMSPEQTEGRPAGPPSDLFSLGVVLYEMATGRRPFRGGSTASLVSSILRDAPPPPSEFRSDLPEPLAALILRCLEKPPERRPASAAAVRDELRVLSREAPRVPPGARPRFRSSPTVLVGAAALVAVAAVFATLGWRMQADATQGPSRSLAVLPLLNLSGDAEQEYFVDGMTEALINQLAGIRALKVISRTSVMRFKNTNRSLPEIARELGVDAIIEGSVQREGDTVRITAQLIEGANEQRIWGDVFERTLHGALRLQADVAGSIAEAIALELSPDEAGQLADARTVDPAAYEAYLRGMHFLAKGTAEGLRQGMVFLNEAVDLDPTDPLPYAGLADGYVLLGHATGEAEYVHRAKAAAVQALQLDPTHAAAQAALAKVALYFEWDWRAAGDAFRRAVKLNPNDAETHAHYAFFHLLFGDLERASAEVELGRELDPLSPFATVAVAELYVAFGLWERVEDAASRALELNPGFPRAHAWLAQALVGRGRLDEALEHARIAADGDPRWRPWLGTTLLAAGRRDEAGVLLEQLLAEPDAGHTVVELAGFQAAYGDPEGALASLERAFTKREIFVPWIGSWADFGDLADDPRFRKLLDEMNLELTRPRLVAQAASL